jgi:hypothetical protein
MTWGTVRANVVVSGIPPDTGTRDIENRMKDLVFPEFKFSRSSAESADLWHGYFFLKKCIFFLNLLDSRSILKFVKGVTILAYDPVSHKLSAPAGGRDSSTFTPPLLIY